MKFPLLLVLPLLLALTEGPALPSSPPPAATIRPTAVARRPNEARVPVVVELFTSEGCSSCPAADAALRELEAAQSVPGVEVLALGQHVDYWNRLGWKDPFSATAFTERQRAYATVFGSGSYTPQAVVNGAVEFIGSQRGHLAEAVTQAAHAPHTTVTVTPEADHLLVTVTNLPAGTPPATLLLAVTETGLSTQVGRGENGGRLLHHAAVVRMWQPLGVVKAEGNGTFRVSVPLTLAPAWHRDHLRAVVLVQENTSRRVVGAGSLALAQ